MPRINVKPVARKSPAANSSRFEARFVNGVHTVFNRDTYSHGPALGTKKQADETAGKLNSGKLKWAA